MELVDEVGKEGRVAFILDDSRIDTKLIVPFIQQVYNHQLNFGSVVTQFVAWENPNPSSKCETQLGTPITVTSIDIPLVLVKEKSNTKEAS
jgi:hypothetical protein